MSGSAALALQSTSSPRRRALEAACRGVAPAWPLDRQVAVSPYWGYRALPFAAAAERLRRLAGAPMTLARAEYLRAWQSGEIQLAHLEHALREQTVVPSVPSAVQALMQPLPAQGGLPLLSDRLDAESHLGSGIPWRTRITQQISEYCAGYFDRLQADWQPDRRPGLLAGWRASLLEDRRFAALRPRAGQLPEDGDAALDWALDRLAVRDTQLTDLLQVIAQRVGGWAAWCAHLRWEAALAGRDDAHLPELLVSRLSWEALLHDGCHNERSAWWDWVQQWNTAACAERSAALAVDLLWQRAHEVAYQHRLFAALRAPRATNSTDEPAPPHAQLVFCIDVRSERMRRAVERTDAGARTYGFAGFFGLPIRYTPLGTSIERAQLPALLAPTLAAIDSSGNALEDDRLAAQRKRTLQRRASLRPFARMPTGAFSTVEMLGLTYLPKLLARAFGRTSAAPESIGLDRSAHASLRPRLLGSGPDALAEQADLAQSILRAMGLGRSFARLLVLIGHGARTANNPQAAALACGACGGNSGDINARILADLLNEPAVRRALAECGLAIPEHTVVLAGLHDTVTDTVDLFDLERVPSSHSADLERLRETLRQAGTEVRRERAPSLGLARFAGRDGALLRRLQRRARDWAEVRPEWGLAGNAAFILAARDRTRGIDLQGRVFLHEYRWQADPDGAMLEQILTGPLIVAHWINLQYYGSTVDPERFGSGNKLLHNVLGGHIGVLEGHSGDLRIGLSQQSVHDGTRWRHAPLRLTVLIDTPRERLERIVQRHSDLSKLIDNQWLYVYRLKEHSLERLCSGRWDTCVSGSTRDGADEQSTSPGDVPKHSG